MSSQPSLIRGADGALYYLPPGELDSYRVDDETASRVMSKLAEVGGTTEEAVAEDAEVSGFAFDAFTPRVFSPRVLGLNPSATMMGDDDETIAYFPGDSLRPRF